MGIGAIRDFAWHGAAGTASLARDTIVGGMDQMTAVGKQFDPNGGGSHRRKRSRKRSRGSDSGREYRNSRSRSHSRRSSDY